MSKLLRRKSKTLGASSPEETDSTSSSSTFLTSSSPVRPKKKPPAAPPSAYQGYSPPEVGAGHPKLGDGRRNSNGGAMEVMDVFHSPSHHSPSLGGLPGQWDDADSPRLPDSSPPRRRSNEWMPKSRSQLPPVSVHTTQLHSHQHEGVYNSQPSSPYRIAVQSSSSGGTFPSSYVEPLPPRQPLPQHYKQSPSASSIVGLGLAPSSSDSHVSTSRQGPLPTPPSPQHHQQQQQQQRTSWQQSVSPHRTSSQNQMTSPISPAKSSSSRFSNDYQQRPPSPSSKPSIFAQQRNSVDEPHRLRIASPPSSPLRTTFTQSYGHIATEDPARRSGSTSPTKWQTSHSNDGSPQGSPTRQGFSMRTQRPLSAMISPTTPKPLPQTPVAAPSPTVAEISPVRAHHPQHEEVKPAEVPTMMKESLSFEPTFSDFSIPPLPPPDSTDFLSSLSIPPIYNPALSPSFDQSPPIPSRPFEPMSLPPPPPTLVEILSHPRILYGILKELPIISVLNFWASGDEVQEVLDDKEGREQIRIWGLSWCGYQRLPRDLLEREDKFVTGIWKDCDSGKILEYLSTLLHPPAQIPTLPWYLQHSTNMTAFLLRNAMDTLPPKVLPTPFLFEEEEEGLLGTATPPPSSPRNGGPPRRPRALGAKELVLPTPLSSLEYIDDGMDVEIVHDGRSIRRDSFASQRPRSVSAFGSRNDLTRVSTRASTVSAAPSAFHLPRAATFDHSTGIGPINKSGLPPVPIVRNPVAKRYQFSSPTGDSSGSASSVRSGAGKTSSFYAGSVYRPPSTYSRGNGSASNLPSTQFSNSPPPVPPLTNEHRTLYTNGTSINSRDSSLGDLSRMSGGASKSLLNSPSASKWRGSGAGGTHTPPFSTSSATSISSASATALATLIEPIFDSAQPPYRYNRAPMIKVYVKMAEGEWPSSQALQKIYFELDRLGYLKWMKVGDLVENLAIEGRWERGAMVFIPPYLQPLSFVHSLKHGHLPASLSAFLLPPSYYTPHFRTLSAPIIVYLSLTRFSSSILSSLRLSRQRIEIPTNNGNSTGERWAEGWVHVAGFEIEDADLRIGSINDEWRGFVTLECDGTKEGRDELEMRVGNPGSKSAGGYQVEERRYPWEIMRERSIAGSIWLRLVKEIKPQHNF